MKTHIHTLALLSLVFLAGGCDKKEIALGIVENAGVELADKRISISPGKWWYSEFTPNHDGTLITQINVNNSAPVLVDLLDKAEFEKFPFHSNHYTSYHRQDILKEVISGDVVAGNMYVLVVRPRFEGNESADVSIKSHFLKKSEK